MKKEKYDTPCIELINVEPGNVIDISTGDNEIVVGDGGGIKFF